MAGIGRRTRIRTAGAALGLLVGLAAGGPATARAQVPETVRAAPWKAPVAGRAAPASLDQYAHRVGGSWISREWVGEGEGRHRVRAVYEWDLNRTRLLETSYRVYADGREERYLESVLFRNGARPHVTVAYLFFEDGLFADAVWIDEGDGMQRLDCDLYWPDGRTGRVRDVFHHRGPDLFHWTTYWIRDGEPEREPSMRLTMVREG